MNSCQNPAAACINPNHDFLVFEQNNCTVSLTMTNKCCIKQAKILHFPGSLWWLRVGSLVHKTSAKGRDPEARLGYPSFVLIFKGCASLSQDQNPQTNKQTQIHEVRYWIFLATFLHDEALINTGSLIAICCWWYFNMPFCLFFWLCACGCYCESLPDWGTSALCGFKQHSDCAVCLVQRGLLVICWHGWS